MGSYVFSIGSYVLLIGSYDFCFVRLSCLFCSGMNSLEKMPCFLGEYRPFQTTLHFAESLITNALNHYQSVGSKGFRPNQADSCIEV